MVQEASLSFASVGRPMRCSNCDFENAAGKKFCIRCGSAFSSHCPECDAENPPEASFCGECGASLGTASAPPRSAGDHLRATGQPQPRVRDAAEVHEGERRQLTVMFCDVVGSTPLSEQLDPEELRDLMRSYQQACVAAVTTFDGHVAKYLGDGLLIYFGYPSAHEDDAARAVRAGLAIVEKLRGLNTQLSHPVHVRVGIHTGLVVAGEMGSVDYPEHLAVVGDTPNIAARLQEQALPDSVVVSPSVIG